MTEVDAWLEASTRDKHRQCNSRALHGSERHGRSNRVDDRQARLSAWALSASGLTMFQGRSPWMYR
jgi:hypothetical protein